MRDCPKCSARVDGLACPSCGYTESGAKPVPMHDPDRHRCIDVWQNARCAKPGSLAESTLGGGPWFCAQHFPAFRNWNRHREIPVGGFAAFRSRSRTRTVAEEAEVLAERAAIESQEAPL